MEYLGLNGGLRIEKPVINGVNYGYMDKNIFASFKVFTAVLIQVYRHTVNKLPTSLVYFPHLRFVSPKPYYLNQSIWHNFQKPVIFHISLLAYQKVF